MPLNIKNERVYRLAQELSELTGKSITAAVGDALETRIAELHRLRNRERIVGELLAIGKRCAAEAPPEWLTRNFDEELYDDRGLPK